MKSGFLLVVCSNLLCHIDFGHGSHHVQGNLELDQKKLNSEDRKPVNDEQMNEGKVAACETTVGDKQPKEGHSDFFVTNESNSAGVFQTAPTRTFNHGHSKARPSDASDSEHASESPSSSSVAALMPTDTTSQPEVDVSSSSDSSDDDEYIAQVFRPANTVVSGVTSSIAPKSMGISAPNAITLPTKGSSRGGDDSDDFADLRTNANVCTNAGLNRGANAGANISTSAGSNEGARADACDGIDDGVHVDVEDARLMVLATTYSTLLPRWQTKPDHLTGNENGIGDAIGGKENID